MADTDSSSELVAVLGGGQLGRMLALAGIPLGLRFRFLDPTAEAPAQAVGDLVVGPLGDEAALREVALDARVATYEWEGVPAAAVRFLAASVPVHPGARSLEVSQDRLVEKETFRRLGIGTPAFAAVDDRAGLERAVDEVGGLPAVLKTRRGGYDGKGQRVVRATSDLDDAWADLGDAPLILEQLMPFDRELSVLAVRGLDGDVACWPWSRTTTRAASSASAELRHPASTPRSNDAAKISRRACSSTSTTSACSRWSSSTWVASSWPTRSPPGCTTPATGPSRAPRPASSRTTSGRSSVSRSGRPSRWDRAPC